MFFPEPSLSDSTINPLTLARRAATRDSVVEWIEAGRPQGTSALYLTYGTQYLDFVREKGLDVRSDTSVASFIYHAAVDRKLGRSTLVSVIPASIAHISRFWDHPIITSSPLVMETKKRAARLAKNPVSKRALSLSILRRLSQSVSSDEISIRDFALIIFSFFWNDARK